MELPPLIQLIRLRKEISQKFHVYINTYGVYNEILTKYKSVLLPIIKRLDIDKKEDKTLRINLRNDGTNVGRQPKLLRQHLKLNYNSLS